MSNDSILIISNSRTISSHLTNKIKLLRDKDTIKCVTFLESISALNATKPSLIMIYCSQADSVEIVKEIRRIKKLDRVPIIFVMDSLSEEKLYKAFDYGTDEFFCLHDSNSIILMRTILALQKSALYRKIEITEAILKEEKILDGKTNLYEQPFANCVLKNVFNISLDKNDENTVFMYLKALPKDKNYVNTTKVATTIRSMLRDNDIVTFSENSGFYIVLFETDEIGALAVYNKLNKALEEQYNLYASATKVSDSFANTEPIVIKSIKQQIMEKERFKYIHNAVQSQKHSNKSSLNISEELERMVISVFYHFQTVYTNTFVNVDVDYNILPEKSSFTLKNETMESCLNISLNEERMVNIELFHSKNNEPVESHKIEFSFDEFSEATLSNTLKDFVNEFSELNSYDKLSRENNEK